MLYEVITINIGVDPNFGPFEFISRKGEYLGMADDYLKIIEAMLGIRFKVKSYNFV